MQVAPKIDKIWYIRQGRKEIMKKTSFIVVGPMSSDNKGITGKRISLYLQEIVHLFNPPDSKSCSLNCSLST